MKLLTILALLVAPSSVLLAQTKVDSLKLQLLKYELQQDIQRQFDKSRAELKDQLETELAKVGLAKQQLDDATAANRRFFSYTLAILGIVSLATLVWLYRYIQSKLKATLDEAIYKVDPRYLPVILPADGMEKQRKRLDHLGFKKLRQYKYLDNTCTRHIVVVLATHDEEARDLRQHIENNNMQDNEQVGFIVFTRGQRISPDILKDFDNVTFANNHFTLVQAMFVVARGIVA